MHNKKQNMVSSNLINPNNVHFTFNHVSIEFVDCASSSIVENLKVFNVPFEVNVTD
jgi:hypothetical protein